MRHVTTRALAGGLLVVPVLCTTAIPAPAVEQAAPAPTHTSTQTPRDTWVAAWATAPQGVYPVGWAVGQPGSTDAKGLTRIPELPNDEARDQTLERGVPVLHRGRLVQEHQRQSADHQADDE